AGRLEVLAAQVYSRVLPGDRTEAVDLFWVRNREEATPEARRFARFLKDLEDVCTGTVDPADLLRARTGSSSPWRERPSPAITTDVVVDDRASPRHTVIEVFAKDRPGLLYTVARTLHELGLTIALSKINTEGTKVADVFYVSELDGTKVVPGERFKMIRDALTGAIE
ncbi:MAG: ACT domain-containing protein, partial [Polyangiaceae bacterium]